MANIKKDRAKKGTAKRSVTRGKTKAVDAFACGCCERIVVVDDCGCAETRFLCC
jgi:hypothetical protein